MAACATVWDLVLLFRVDQPPSYHKISAFPGEAILDFSSINIPGALYLAWWMSVLLHAIKIELLRSQISSLLPKGIVLASGQLRNERFWSVFSILYLQQPHPLHQTWSFAHNAFVIYICWHLTLWLINSVPLVVCYWGTGSTGIKNQWSGQQSKLENKSSKRHGSGFGKPVFIKCLLFATVSDELSALNDMILGAFFALLVFTSFFNAPVTHWQANDAHQQGKLIVDITRVANNYAECKVKPCQDFNGSSQTENHFQCILQVAENSHQTSKCTLLYTCTPAYTLYVYDY